jgi:hypothetical protein
VLAALVEAREPAKDWIFLVPMEINWPVELTEKPVSVTAPVVLFSLITLNPPLERTGPEKVVFAILHSCRGKCQLHSATVRDLKTIHKKRAAEKPPFV